MWKEENLTRVMYSQTYVMASRLICCALRVPNKHVKCGNESGVDVKWVTARVYNQIMCIYWQTNIIAYQIKLHNRCALEGV